VTPAVGKQEHVMTSCALCCSEQGSQVVADIKCKDNAYSHNKATDLTAQIAAAA